MGAAGPGVEEQDADRGRPHAGPASEQSWSSNRYALSSDAELVELDGCEHAPFWEDPEAFSSAVSEFIARRAQPAPAA